MNRMHLTWKKAVVVSAVCAGAAISGVWTEVLAQAQNDKFTSKGRQLTAEWSFSDETSSTSASVDASQNVTGPGKPNPTTVAFASGSDWASDGSGFTQFSAGGDIKAGDLVFGGSGVGTAPTSGSLATTISGFQSSWDTTTGDWTETPIDAQISVALTALAKPVTEMSSQRVHDRENGTITSWRYNASSVFDTSGSGGIQLDDGVSVASFIPANTATSWGTLRTNRNSSMTVVTP